MFHLYFQIHFKKKSKIKLYKNNFFFKKIFVSWPQIFGTSTISCSREILDKFFKEGKPFLLELFSYRYKVNIICSHTI